MAKKKILSIQKIKRDYRLSFYDNSELDISYKDYFKYDLFIDGEIDSELLEILTENYHYYRCYEFGLKRIKNKRYTVAEMKKKLKAREFTGNIIERVIEEFLRLNLLNDEDYAEIYILNRMENDNDGYLKIKRSLEKRGIPTGIIENQLSELITDEYEADALEKLIEKKIKTYSDKLTTQKKKEKLFLYLKNKGFFRGKIVSALIKYFK
ncbi:regulatory protein RecX [Candidatus Dependentiae bacterium]|nr:regulatory protein RecX [Candidatus Dependentiae bacterium]